MRANDHESSSDDERERAVAGTRDVLGGGGVGGGRGRDLVEFSDDSGGIRLRVLAMRRFHGVFRLPSRLVLSVDRQCHLSIYLSIYDQSAVGSRQLAAAPFLSLARSLAVCVALTRSYLLPSTYLVGNSRRIRRRGIWRCRWMTRLVMGRRTFRGPTGGLWIGRVRMRSVGLSVRRLR